MGAGNGESLAGIVLGKELSGERHWKLTVLSPEEGVVVCLWRVSHKQALEKPDLFDRAEIDFGGRGGVGSGFVSNYRVLQRQPELGNDYRRLSLACRLALLVLRNPPAAGAAGQLFCLCEAALAALAERPLPEMAYFKFLWKWMLSEGYPVREQWLGGLSEERRGATARMLRQPLDGQTETVATARDLTGRLERWMAGECHFILPDQK